MSSAHLGTQLRSAAQQTWRQRSPRERLLLGWGAGVLALAGVWGIALAPAWRTWQEAPARQAQLDTQTQRMQQLQAQAKSLQKPTTLSRSEAAAWLEQSLATLGANAKLQVQGERATLSVEAAPAEAMAQWLRLARENAQALPEQAQLQRTGLAKGPAQGPADRQTAGPQTSSPSAPQARTDSTEVLWRGSLVLRLP